MESYREIKERHQKEVNAFPKGAAFGNDQFIEMMKNWGFDCCVENGKIESPDLDKIVSLGYGVYILKKDAKDWVNLTVRQSRELKEFRKQRKELKKAMVEEFFNHECMYDGCYTTALSDIGITEQDIEKDKELASILNSAINEFRRKCLELSF